MARSGVRVRFQRVGGALASAALILALSGGSSSAQGIFDILFGGFKRLAPPAQSSYADPNQAPAPGSHDGAPSRDYAGGGPYFCVRMCDGRYFPIGNRAGASAVELCRSFCPNAPTQIFSGSKIDHSVAPGGRRYSEIPNAFVYREKMVPGCTCDGKSATGLVRLDPRDDPTLRPGDFVATGQGLMAYRGGNGSTTEFSPISNVPGISANLRAQLSATRVAPGRNVEDAPDPEADGELAMSRNVPQRDQAAR